MKQLLFLILVVSVSVGCSGEPPVDPKTTTENMGTTDANGVQTMPSGATIQRNPDGSK